MLIKNVSQRKSRQYPLYENFQFDDEEGNHYDWLIRHTFFNNKLGWLCITTPKGSHGYYFIHNHKLYLLSDNELLEVDKVITMDDHSVGTASKFVEALKYRMIICRCLKSAYGTVNLTNTEIVVALFASNWAKPDNRITIPLTKKGYQTAVKLGICRSSDFKPTVRSLQRYIGGEIV